MTKPRRLKAFREYLAQIEAEQEYVVIALPGDLGSHLLFEGWKDAGVGDLVYRVDAANTATHGERHIHIAHRKHRAAKNKQVAWNQSGTRHDRGSFDPSFSPRKAAEAIARRVLNISGDVVLEQFDRAGKTAILLEEAAEGDELPDDAILLALRLDTND